MIELDVRTIPPGAIPCPRCGSGDTAPYKWPDDLVTRHFLANTPEALRKRVCVDCRHLFQEPES